MAGEIILRTLEHVWDTLEPTNVPMALMGGLAAAAWGHVRATHDVDLLVAVQANEFDRVAEALTAGGLRPKGRELIRDLGTMRIAQFLYEPPDSFVDVQVDLLLAECEYQRSALARRVPTLLEGMSRNLDVLSCEDLVLHKLLAGRIVDRADAAALVRANRPGLDFDYMRVWIAKLDVAKPWNEIWSEAFPGEEFL